MLLLDFLRGQPTLAVFLAIGIGYLVDRVRPAGIQLGVTTGVLFAGLLFGHLGMHGSGASQSVGFMLFIYCVGLRAGPQFFQAFRENGIGFAVLSLVVAVVGVVVAVSAGRLLDLPPGYAAGLLAGALTSTPTLVAAQDAVRDGVAVLPAGVDAGTVTANIAASYAISYVVGMFGLLVVVAVLPRAMGIDLREEARRLEAERPATGPAAGTTAYADLPLLRVYRLTRDVADLAALRRAGLLPQQVKRDAAVLAPDALRGGDLVSVLGTRAAHATAPGLLGPEASDAALLDVAAAPRAIVVTAAATAGTVADAAAGGCIVTQVTRAGIALPVTSRLRLAKGDLVVAVGLPRALDALAARIGRSELPAHETDLVTFAFGMAAGIAIGVLSVRVAGIPIGLSTAGGLLLVGLVIGWARTSNPTFGQVPAAAATVLMELGLQFFIANVGLEAGGSVVDALRTTGVSLPIAAFVVMATPVVTGVVVGRLLLGLDAVTLLGALTGALTSTPALDMINRKADSALPTVGYAGTYAFANVLLAVAGSILMRL